MESIQGGLYSVFWVLLAGHGKKFGLKILVIGISCINVILQLKCGFEDSCSQRGPI